MRQIKEVFTNEKFKDVTKSEEAINQKLSELIEKKIAEYKEKISLQNLAKTLVEIKIISDNLLFMKKDIDK